MAFVPLTLGLPQGPYFSPGRVLKAYLASTSTATPLYTDTTGATPAATVLFNADSLPTVGGSVIMPHQDTTVGNIDVVLYPDQSSADTDSGALLTFSSLIPGVTAYDGADGTAANPTYSFATDTDVGWYLSAVGTINLSVGGTSRLNVTTSGINAEVPITIPQGSASVPSVAVQGDLDTGIFQDAIGELNFSCQGTTRFSVTTNGAIVPTGYKIGMGTSSPSYDIDLQKAVNPQLGLTDTTNNVKAYMTATDTYAMIGSDSAHSMSLNTNGVQRVFLDTSGNVGVGTSSPAVDLDVGDTTNGAIWVRGVAASTTPSGTPASPTDGGLYLGDNSSQARWAFLPAETAGQDYLNLFTDVSNAWYHVMSFERATGNIGIGTTNPNSLLEVGDGDTTTDNSVISIIGGSLGFSSLLLGDPDDINSGAVQYDHTNDRLALRSNNADRAYLDSSGNFLVGKSNTTFSTSGARLGSSGEAEITRDSATPLSLNRTTTDGNVLTCFKDGSSVGSIGIEGTNNLYLGGSVSNHGGILFSDIGASQPTMLPCSTAGVLADNAVNIGNATYRWESIYLGTGAYIGGTGAANLFDDYEEGTWTPTIQDTTFSDGEGQSYTTQVGTYTKVGRQVTARCRIVIAGLGSLTSGDQAYIGGLPFTSSSTANTQSAVLVGDAKNMSLGAAGYSITGYVTPNTSRVTMQVFDGTAGTTGMLISELSSTSQLVIAIVYEV